ncbi:MAG TPA: acyl-CoA dehydrogenase family protein [Steroidobacteraceae bacterium]|nr:acyl-CoA dehydrogenase family protein [Steroidobacteraceae bacterium]
MDFTLSDDQLMIQAAAREFAQNEIVPVAASHDASGEFPHETIRKAGELGFMGIEVPPEYGGSGLDAVSFVVVMEEIAAADAAHATIVSVNNSLYCNGIMEFGTDEQRRKFVQPVATGKAVGCYGLSEPQSGSDSVGMRTRATLSPDKRHYVVNGKKSWITSGPVANFMLLFAITDPAKKGKGITAFVLDTTKPGYLRGKTEPKLGIRASATCEIEFSDYHLPVENRLGEEGQGFKIAMAVLDQGRIGIAAQAVGIARAAYDASVVFAKERVAFGAPIGSFQMIQQKIADMKVRLEAARLLTMRAAWNKARARRTGERNSVEASMAKLFASEAAMYIAHQAVQIHAGMGYSKEMPIERYFRDAKITEIYEGTSEIQRLVIARSETGLR